MVELKVFKRKPKADIRISLLSKKDAEELRHTLIRDGEIVENSKLDVDSYLFSRHNNTLYYIMRGTSYRVPYTADSMAEIARILSKFNVKTAQLGTDLNNLSDNAVFGLCLGFLLGTYTPTIEISTDSGTTKTYIESQYPLKVLYVKLDKSREELLYRAMTYFNCLCFVKDITNTPANIQTPLVFANSLKELSMMCKLDYTCYTRSSSFVKNMGGLLAVAEGSSYEPYVVKMVYKSDKCDKDPIRIGLVGKGVTYDTGGLSIKPTSSMCRMKYDKAGAAAVAGVMMGIRTLNLPNIEVEAIVGIVENSIGGDSYRPGDVVTMKNGKTVEITNTDAEGRLVLADCLTGLQESGKPFDVIIDIATLTGSCAKGIGPFITGAFSLNEPLRDAYCALTGIDTTWPMPVDHRLAKYLTSSDIADFVNCVEMNGDAIMAFLFLKEFVLDNFSKYLHLDICGSGFVSDDTGILSKGATGAGVIGLLNFVRAISYGQVEFTDKKE